MGGMCDTELSSSDYNGILGVGMSHIEEAHPEMAADIKAMPNDDPKMLAWYEKLMKVWEAAPETE